MIAKLKRTYGIAFWEPTDPVEGKIGIVSYPRNIGHFNLSKEQYRVFFNSQKSAIRFDEFGFLEQPYKLRI